MIKLPESTRLSPVRRVPKERCYLGRTGSAELKRVITDEVDKILWTNKLSATSLNVAPSEDVREIEIFETTLTTKAVNPLVYKTLDAAIRPHVALHFFTTSDHFEVVFGYWAPGEKTGRYYARSWPTREEAALDFSGDSLGAVYLSLMRQLQDKEADATPQGMTDVKSWRETDNRRAQLERKLQQLEKRLKSERQVNVQFEISGEMRRIRKELQGLKG